MSSFDKADGEMLAWNSPVDLRLQQINQKNKFHIVKFSSNLHGWGISFLEATPNRAWRSFGFSPEGISILSSTYVIKK